MSTFAPMTPPTLEQFTEALNCARTGSSEEFATASAKLLASELRFDNLMLLFGPLADLSLLQGIGYGVDDPHAAMASYSHVATLDPITPRLLLQPGRAQSWDIDDPELETTERRPFREHLSRFGLMHGGGVLQYIGQEVFVMGAMRSTPGEKFGPEELATLERWCPTLGQLALVHGSSRWTKVSHNLESLTIAYADAKGAVLRATEAFVKLYSGGTPTTQAYFILSPECLRAFRRNEAWTQDGVILTATQEGSGWLVRVKRPSRADALSARERQIATAFAAGLSAPEIAAELAISRATVRRHLANIYSKLEVAHRVELIDALSEAQ